MNHNLKNAGKHWTKEQVKQLKTEAAGNTPTGIIALHMQRTEDSIRAQAQKQNITLKPTNQSPYGTAGKRKPAR